MSQPDVEDLDDGDPEVYAMPDAHLPTQPSKSYIPGVYTSLGVLGTGNDVYTVPEADLELGTGNDVYTVPEADQELGTGDDVYTVPEADQELGEERQDSQQTNCAPSHQDEQPSESPKTSTAAISPTKNNVLFQGKDPRRGTDVQRKTEKEQTEPKKVTVTAAPARPKVGSFQQKRPTRTKSVSVPNAAPAPLKPSQPEKIEMHITAPHSVPDPAPHSVPDPAPHQKLRHGRLPKKDRVIVLAIVGILLGVVGTIIGLVAVARPYSQAKGVDKLELAFAEQVDKLELAAEQIDTLKLAFAEQRNNLSLLINSGDAVYTVWGNDTCGPGSARLYNGYAAGTRWDQAGTSDILCFPHVPQYGQYSAEGGGRFGKAIYDVRNQNHTFTSNSTVVAIPCVVCEAKGKKAVFMQPATLDCPSEWNREYHGYLSTQRANASYQARVQTLCIIHDFSTETENPAPTDVDYVGPVLFKAGVACPSATINGVCNGSSGSSPYYNNRGLTCSVCSK